MPGINSTQSPSVSGLFVSPYGHYRKELRPSPPAVAADASSTASEALASAIAAALTQLGLTSQGNVAGSDNTSTTDSASIALLLPQQKASPQIQQYKSTASMSSSLAQALRANSSGTPSASSGDSSLTAVFQSLWASLGASSGMAVDASNSAMPSVQSFTEMLARNFSQSGITGLRGVFVDTVV